MTDQEFKDKVKALVIELDQRTFPVKLLDDVQREMWEEGKEERDGLDSERREQYQRKKEEKRLRGEEFKKTIKVGDIVKVEGTSDRVGIREVMETDDWCITARKIQKSRKYNQELETWETVYKYDSYITQHQWNKIEKKLELKITE